MPRSLSDQFSFSLVIFDWSPQKTLMLNEQPSNLSICAPAKIAWSWIWRTVKTFCCVVVEILIWFSSDWADVPGSRFRIADISRCRFRDAEWQLSRLFKFLWPLSCATKFGWTSASKSRPTPPSSAGLKFATVCSFSLPASSWRSADLVYYYQEQANFFIFFVCNFLRETVTRSV